MLMMKISFAGKEFHVFNAAQKLREIEIRMIQIRTHLGLNMNESIQFNHKERNMQYEKFDQLWSEFLEQKTFLQQELRTYKEKVLLVSVALCLWHDKKRYAQERARDPIDSIIASMFQRLMDNGKEELTQ